MGRPSDEAAAFIAERRTAALELRTQGLPLAEIGRRLTKCQAMPYGYTSTGKQLTAAVARDIGQSIRARYKANREAAGELAADLLGRLELMWSAVEDRVAEGDLRAIETGLKILERTARLTGVEASPLSFLGPDGEQRVVAALALFTDAAHLPAAGQPVSPADGG